MGGQHSLDGKSGRCTVRCAFLARCDAFGCERVLVALKNRAGFTGAVEITGGPDTEQPFPPFTLQPDLEVAGVQLVHPVFRLSRSFAQLAFAHLLLLISSVMRLPVEAVSSLCELLAFTAIQLRPTWLLGRLNDWKGWSSLRDLVSFSAPVPL